MRRSSLALSALMFLFLATNAFAGAEARMTGKILDKVTKEPIPNAVLNLSAVSGKTVKATFKSRKDGAFTLTVLDGTLRYKFVITADGYAPYEEEIKMIIGEANHRNFELDKPATGQTVQAEVQMQGGGDPAVVAYNEGATLINSGDVAGGIAKFEEAVATKPDLTAGWMALAKANLRAKNYQKAIEAGKKALEFDAEDTDMWTVLYQSYTELGDKANAAIAKKKMPANPTQLFNEAARLINQGKDDDARSLLEQAVAADPTFAIGYYELGMVYARTGKTAEARQALEKYLELEPNGKDAATAKEMIGYLK